MRSWVAWILPLVGAIGCAGSNDLAESDDVAELRSRSPGTGFPMGVFTPPPPGPSAFGPTPVPGTPPACALAPRVSGTDAHPNLPAGNVNATFTLTHDFVPTATLGPRRYVSTCHLSGDNPGVVHIDCDTSGLEMTGVVEGDVAALSYRGRETRRTVDRADLTVTFYSRCDSVWARSDFSREKGSRTSGTTRIDDRSPLPHVATVVEGSARADLVWETTGATCSEACAGRGQRCLQGSVKASHWGASCTFMPSARLSSCATRAMYTRDACAPFLECLCTE